MKYGRLTVVENLGLLPTEGRKRTFVRATCDCGKEKVLPLTALVSGSVQSCGCLRSETGTEHFRHIGHARKTQAGRPEFIAMYDVYKRRAKRHRISFELNFDQFFELTVAPCHYCLAAVRDGLVYVHNGIDRLDSKKGYEPDNVVPCCQFCNRAKMGKPIAEFEEWLRGLGAESCHRPQGWVSIDKITDSFGKNISIEKALHYGWIKSNYATEDQVRTEALEGAPNLFLDQGRQLLAYAFGFRAPIENYTCQKFGVGTGVTTARVTDVALEAPVALASVSGATTAPITSVDYLTAFVMRVGFTVAIGDANGYLLTELGLFSGNNTLLARKIRSVGINKTSDFAPTLTWRIRF